MSIDRRRSSRASCMPARTACTAAAESSCACSRRRAIRSSRPSHSASALRNCVQRRPSGRARRRRGPCRGAPSSTRCRRGSTGSGSSAPPRRGWRGRRARPGARRGARGGGGGSRRRSRSLRSIEVERSLRDPTIVRQPGPWHQGHRSLFPDGDTFVAGTAGRCTVRPCRSSDTVARSAMDPRGARRVPGRGTHVHRRDGQSRRPARDRALVRVGRQMRLALLHHPQPALDRSRARPARGGAGRVRRRLRRAAGRRGLGTGRGGGRGAADRGARRGAGRAGAPRRRSTRPEPTEPSADGMFHDGRHAWLKLTPTKVASWDFRKLGI